MRLPFGRHGQVVRQGSAKPSFPGSNPGGASRERPELRQEHSGPLADAFEKAAWLPNYGRYALALAFLSSLACARRSPAQPAPTTIVESSSGDTAPTTSPEDGAPSATDESDARARLDGGTELDAPSATGYSKRLDFRSGDPVVAVRLMEGQQEVTF